MTPTNAEALAELLVAHGRADDLNAMVDDKKRPHSEREAIEGLQNVAMKAAAELRHLLAERDALRADAERYRWLAGRCRRTPEHWGGRWSIVIDGPCPKDGPGRETVDAAIDAAMKGTQ